MIKRGSPKRASLARNCLICTKWLTCRDPDKAGNYACSRFKESEEGADALMELFDKQNTPVDGEDIEQRIAEANDEQSISDIIEEVITSGIPVPPDLRINDRHINKPNNVFEWITDPRYIGGQQVPFAKQIEVAVHMMGEYCPKCTDNDYFEDVPVGDSPDDVQERTVFLKKGVCPKCKSTKSDLVAEQLLLDPTQMVGIAGQRSSKSATFHMIESYGASRLLVTPSLPKIFNILPSTPLISTYTGTTYGQARRNLWDPLHAIFTESTWFKEYNAFIKAEGYRLGEELVVLNDTSLRYRHKNMWLAASPPSKRTMRGATRWSIAIDELGWFPVGNTKSGKDFERLDAKEVHKALLNSLRTMKSAYRMRLKAGYSNIPKPTMVNISSPSSINDMIMTLYRQQQNSRETYCFLYKTWEYNPLLPESEFADEFRTNPIEAARDYACEPPLGANAYFTDKEALLSTCTGGKNAIKVTSNRFSTKSGKKLMGGNYKLQRRTESNYSGVLAIDAGYKFDSFAFAIAYPVTLPTKMMGDDVDEDEETTSSTRVRIHAVGEVIAKPGIPVSFNAMYRDILLPFVRDFNIGAVISDRWQNIKLLQDLEDAEGTAYFEHRLSKANFDDYREAIFDKNIVMPKPEMEIEDIVNTTLDDYPHCFYLKPVSHLIYQHLTVVSHGSTVVKGEATDDMFRTCVLAYTALQLEVVLEELTAVYDDDKITGALGALATGSSSSISTAGAKPMAGIGGKFSLGGASPANTSGSLGSVYKRR